MGLKLFIGGIGLVALSTFVGSGLPLDLLGRLLVVIGSVLYVIDK